MKIPRGWNLAYCDDIECAITKDGLLFAFTYDSIAHLLAHYPLGHDGWFFNDSCDRYIAERYNDDLITVNPQFCYQNFTTITT